MKKSVPNLYSEIIPGSEAAGFSIGESFSDISKRVGTVDWYGPEVSMRNILLGNSGWVGVKRNIGFGNESLLSYRYMNQVVSLFFEKKEKLYRIALGEGYHGNFDGVGIGENLKILESNFEIIFNDADDDFLIKRNGSILTGISFVTDYRASLEDVPQQVIKFISIHDWSLR